jgi:p-aminobenzoyl-glutamate transporter AbgT
MDIEDITSHSDTSSSSLNRVWKLCGEKVPRSQALFLSQIIILYIIILSCLFNLSFENGRSEMWLSLLCTCIGALLPQPKFHRSKIIEDVNKLGRISS